MRWKDEAIEKLKRYPVMLQALENIPAEIKRLKADAAGLQGVNAERVHVRGGGGRREEALINNLMQRQELEWTLGSVQQWLAVADRGLAALNPEERLVLQRMYLCPEGNAISRLCAELGVEQASVYRKRDKALRRFTLALYGFPET